MDVSRQCGSLRGATSVLAATVLTAGVGILGVLGTAQPASAAAATIDRAAFGISATGTLAVAPTPRCPERFTVGKCDKQVARFISEVPEFVSTGVLTARTVGTADPLRARSQASAAEVDLLDGLLTADLIESQCAADAGGLTGSATLAGATFNDVPIAVSPEPNTVLFENDDVRIVVNEQIVSPDGNQITVNAVHITIDGEGSLDLIVASSQCSFHPGEGPGTGFLEICKRADNGNGDVTGRFRFRFDGQRVTVPVGSCSGPIQVPAGRLTVTEVAKDGTRISGCNTRPVQRLLRCDPAKRQAVVRIVEGGIKSETVLFITNKRTVIGDNHGAIKVCKIAGDGVKVGTNFDFTVGKRNITVKAGPANQGGYCQVLHRFDRGSNVKITEAARKGVHVSQIKVRPVERKIAANKDNRTATVRVGKGFTVVSFTNTANQQR